MAQPLSKCPSVLHGVGLAAAHTRQGLAMSWWLLVPGATSLGTNCATSPGESTGPGTEPQLLSPQALPIPAGAQAGLEGALSPGKVEGGTVEGAPGTGWDQLGSKVPSNTNHSMVPWSWGMPLLLQPLGDSGRRGAVGPMLRAGAEGGLAEAAGTQQG